MRAPLRRSGARRLVVAAAVTLLVPFLPLPMIEFVATAEASTTPLPSLRAVTGAARQSMEAATGRALDGERSVGTEPRTDEFSMIGVAFDEQPTQPVLTRLLEADGGWTDWFELEVAADEGPDAAGAEAAGAEADGSAAAATTEPLWVGSAVGYEVSLATGDAAGARVALVRESERRVLSESVPLADASTAAPFGIQSRSSWGARATSTSSATRLDLAVVHHTASSNNYSAAQVPSILRSIQAFHIDTNKWSDIGYNFLVDRFGRIWEGRGGGVGNPVVGAHAAGFNTRSVGVSIIGNFVGASASVQALEATSKLIGWKLGTYGVDPAGRANITSGGSSTIPAGRVVNLPRVVGHRDVGATSCPGSVYGSLGAVRNRSSQLYRSYETLRNPGGHLDGVRLAGRRVTVQGWAKDPDTANTVTVHVSVGGRWSVIRADRHRPDVAAAHPGHGANRGFAMTADGLPNGPTTVCAYAINQGRGTGNTTLGCRQVVVK